MRPLTLVTLEGYAVEGGLDQPGGPFTVHNAAIATGLMRGPDVGDQLWQRYEAALAVVPKLSVDGVVLTLEWARIQPHPDRVDEAALSRYVDVVSCARGLGLQISVALVGFTWPSWLGEKAWLMPWVSDRVVEHAVRIATHLPDVNIVPFLDEDYLIKTGYIEGSQPPFLRRDHVSADLARQQLRRTHEKLGAREELEGRLVSSFVTGTLEELEQASPDVTQWHIRSLLKGRGPTAAPEGFLIAQGEGFSLGPRAGELAKLR